MEVVELLAAPFFFPFDPIRNVLAQVFYEFKDNA